MPTVGKFQIDPVIETEPPLIEPGVFVPNFPPEALKADGSLTGAACWRADGTPIGISGGPARPDIRFNLGPGRAT